MSSTALISNEQGGGSPGKGHTTRDSYGTPQDSPQPQQDYTPSSREGEQPGVAVRNHQEGRTWHGDPRLKHCVAIVNRMSGERSAAEHVFQNMGSLVGGHRVLDLTIAVFKNPQPLIDLIARHAIPNEKEEGTSSNDPQMEFNRGTVIVSGGDGTVSFVMQMIDKLQEQMTAAGKPKIQIPAVAVLALGTGNDLSNCLGFGNGYTKNALCCCCVCLPNDITKIANGAIAAPAVSFDRWDIKIETLGTNVDPATGEPEVLNTETHISNNYFSLGMDAFIAKEFDAARKKHPSCFRLRTMNKMWYGNLGLVGWWNCSRLNDFVTLSVEGVPTHVPPKSKALVVSNVNSYSGGGKLWVLPKSHSRRAGKHSAAANTNTGGRPFNEVDVTPVYINDGKMEIQALGGLVDMSCLQLHVGGGAGKIHQAASCVINVHGADCAAAKAGKKLNPIFMQVDGEPAGCATGPTRITVTKHQVQGFVRCGVHDVVLGKGAPQY